MQHAANPLNPVRNAMPDWDAKPFLEKVTDVVPSMIYIYNQRTQSNEYSNRSIGEALGFSTHEVKQIGADMLVRLCHPDDLPRISVHFSHIATLQDGEVADIEYRARHKDGHWVWLLSRDAVFQRGPENDVLRHIGVAADITAQKEAEERALAEQLKSQTVNDEFRAFSYAMSHDMKAPSHTLQLLLGELMECHGMTLSADARELAEMALLTAHQLSTLVADVREYTGLIGTQSQLQEVALNAVFADVLSGLRDRIATTQAQISIDDLPVVRGDPAQLRLMFHHLMENAMKFQPSDATPYVSVTCAATANATKGAITVKDNGIGIAPHDQEKMFGVFKRLKADTDVTGSGLGLAICRRVAANHGDAISVCSQPGAGAAFTVRLNLS